MDKKFDYNYMSILRESVAQQYQIEVPTTSSTTLHGAQPLRKSLKSRQKLAPKKTSDAHHRPKERAVEAPGIHLCAVAFAGLRPEVPQKVDVKFTRGRGMRYTAENKRAPRAFSISSRGDLCADRLARGRTTAREWRCRYRTMEMFTAISESLRYV